MSKIGTAISLIKNNRDEFMLQIVRRFNFLLPDKCYIKLFYRYKMGRKLDLKNPQRFTEKLQWLKLYNRKPEYTMMVDKYAVKDYISKIVGEKYVIPTLGIWNSPEEIDWESLPDQFVLKTTHGGGNTGVVICKNKNTFNRDQAIRKLNNSMKQNLYKALREWPYKNVTPRILAEQYMVDSPEKEDLPDYKWYCFNGEPEYCQVINNRTSCETIDFYDKNWIHQEFIGLNPVNGPFFENSKDEIVRPSNLDEQIYIARKLSEGIPFARIDLYVIKKNTYFGEITFYPASGFGTFKPVHYNELLGKMLSIDTRVS